MSDKLLAPAVVAVVFTGFTNLYLERRKAGRDLATKIADSLRDDLRSLQISGVEYWSRARKQGDEAIEARLLASQEDVLETLTLLDGEFQLGICDRDDLRPELLDSLTGGDFQSAERKADPSRVIRLSKTAGELRSRIIRNRTVRLRRRGV
ncbi:hypothetical protein [Phenylobacterium sp.]|uniref:hypothetical protein n=1 Tax=Phenylobacterium sp. TaxID=1871053 RepID=UPI002E37AD32|nr:hypothetical protein [Phenylobacterium sp.]